MVSAGASQPSHPLRKTCPEYLNVAAASESVESLARAAAAAEQLKETLPIGSGTPFGVILTCCTFPCSEKFIHTDAVVAMLNVVGDQLRMDSPA